MILQDLCQTLGVAATLPETAIKDLVLQVIYSRIYFHFYSTNIYCGIFTFIVRFAIFLFLNCRELEEFRLAVSCKKPLPNINMRASIAFILHVLGQIPKNSSTCWKIFLEKLMKKTWTLNNWKARKRQPSIMRQHELRRPQFLRSMEPSLRIELLVSSCGPRQFPLIMGYQ